MESKTKQILDDLRAGMKQIDVVRKYNVDKTYVSKLAKVVKVTTTSTCSQSAPLTLTNKEWAYFINALNDDNLDEALKRLYNKKPKNLTNLF
jgi:hypothetical protein